MKWRKIVTHHTPAPRGNAACGYNWMQGSTDWKDVDCKRCNRIGMLTDATRFRAGKLKARVAETKRRRATQAEKD